jgi:predicted lysophospholipase L1 biosynthesis ABC-type transport system permease subunit
MLTIVGTVTLPSFGVNRTDHVSLGRGAMLSEQALLTAEGAPSGSPPSSSQASQAIPSAVAFDLVPGTSAAQRGQLVRRITAANPDGTPGGTYELQLDRALGAEIVNASQMSGQPLVLALGVAAAAMLSLALTVLTSVRRRRRELALLKTLGMTRGQVRSVVACQTSVVLIIAALIGVPLGVAAGRWTWTAFASSIGVVPATVVPVSALVLGFLGLLAAGHLLAAWPAAMAARTPSAAPLRAE